MHIFNLMCIYAPIYILMCTSYFLFTHSSIEPSEWWELFTYYPSSVDLHSCCPAYWYFPFCTVYFLFFERLAKHRVITHKTREEKKMNLHKLHDQITQWCWTAGLQPPAEPTVAIPWRVSTTCMARVGGRWWRVAAHTHSLEVGPCCGASSCLTTNMH